MFIYVTLVLSLLCASVLSLEENSPCVTPNGEKAKCIPIKSCTVIRQAITYLNEQALNFARASHCGKVNGTHLVCCGSSGNFTQTTPVLATVTRPTPSHMSSVFESSVVPQPTPIVSVNLPDHTLCGIQKKESRIHGGTQTEIDEYPWMALLKYVKDDNRSDGGFRCGGTLINNRYVLTAAQCLNIKGFRLVAVRLGEWRISTEFDCVPDTQHHQVCADAVVDIKIVRTVPHPYYMPRSGNNDIALLQLEEKVKYTDFIRPICLPPANYPAATPGMMMVISGWGVTENGRNSDVKLKVSIPVVPTEVCAQIYPINTTVNANQICAGGEQGKDACRGDSGGPLMRTFDKPDDEESQWYQEAIIYRGLGCGRKDVPGLYTRLSRFTNWILNEIKRT